MLNLHFLDINNDILRKNNQNIEVFDEKLQNKIDDMFELMELSGGVGLAAPQAGLNENMFVWRWEGKNYVAINPTIKNPYPNHSPHVCIEGCLSIPGESYSIIRWNNIQLSAQVEDGRGYYQVFSGYEAHIIQHEFDHLQGKLICDDGIKNPL